MTIITTPVEDLEVGDWLIVRDGETVHEMEVILVRVGFAQGITYVTVLLPDGDGTVETEHTIGEKVECIRGESSDDL